ncbi:hypothetical protein [Actinosynnema sp. NPDC020468]|uniref:hypothetical protein n=1 Tax=Actinosynnema sp. NPDC020468 TaxID=3154488 RepID=UPI0033E5574F
MADERHEPDTAEQEARLDEVQRKIDEAKAIAAELALANPDTLPEADHDESPSPAN